MTEVLDKNLAIKVLRGMYPLRLPAAKKSKTKPPELAKLFLVGELTPSEKTPEAIEEDFIVSRKFQNLFGLSSQEVDDIAIKCHKEGKAFIKAYVYDIAKVKMEQANSEILKGFLFQVNIQ